MKKIFFTAILTVFFVVCFCSCESASYEKNNKALPKLIIASDNFEPFFYTDDGENFSGIDIELATEACKRIGYQPVFKKINWDEKDYLLNEGVIDCIWGGFIITGRENNYTCAGPYMYSHQVAMVCSNSNIKNLEDLAGKKIAVQIDSKPEDIFLNNLSSNIPEVSQIYTFSSFDDVIASLQEGYVDAIVDHESVFSAYIKEENNCCEIISQNLLKVQLGVAFSKKGNNILADALTQKLDEMKYDGTIDKITEKYGLDAKKFVWGND